jgi:hypothetical protein
MAVPTWPFQCEHLLSVQQPLEPVIDHMQIMSLDGHQGLMSLHLLQPLEVKPIVAGLCYYCCLSMGLVMFMQKEFSKCMSQNKYIDRYQLVHVKNISKVRKCTSKLLKSREFQLFISKKLLCLFVLNLITNVACV